MIFQLHFVASGPSRSVLHDPTLEGLDCGRDNPSETLYIAGLPVSLPASIAAQASRRYGVVVRGGNLKDTCRLNSNRLIFSEMLRTRRFLGCTVMLLCLLLVHDFEAQQSLPGDASVLMSATD